MLSIKDENRKLPLYLFTLFGIVITLNYTLIRYAGDLLIPLTEGFLLFSIIIIYGFSINSLFTKKIIGLPESLASGLIFTTFYFFLLSSLKLLYPVFIILFYLFPVPLLISLILKKRSDFNNSLKFFFNRPFSEFGIFIFPFIYASLPSSFYDTLVYHLGIPNIYLLHGGFIATPQLIYANTSIYYEISLIPSLYAGQLVPRIFHLLIGITFCLALTDTAVRYFNLKKRFMFLLLLVSIPLTFFLLTTVNNDLIGAFFILIGIRCYLKGCWKFSALFWGFSIGVKYFNIIPMILFLILIIFKGRFKNPKENIKLLFIFGSSSLLVLLPLFIKNYILIKNPFFPFFTGLFEHGYFDISRYEVMKNDVGVLIHSFKDILSLPYNLSFREIGSGGLIGVQFLIFLPFIFLKKQINARFYLIFSLLLILTGAFFTSSIRFLYIAVALLCIYVILLYESAELRDSKIVKSIFIILIALNMITVFGYQERIYRAYYLYSGKMNSEEYKTALFPTYQAISYVNRNTPENSIILVVGDTRNFYLKRRYYVSSAIDYSILKGYLDNSETGENFINSLRKDGIDYILYNSSEFVRLNRIYNRLNTSEGYKFSEFLKLLDPVFHKDYRYVYKIPSEFKNSK